MKYSTVKQLGGKGAGEQIRYLRAGDTECLVYWYKVKDLEKTSRRGRGLSHTKSSQTQCKVRGLSP